VRNDARVSRDAPCPLTSGTLTSHLYPGAPLRLASLGLTLDSRVSPLGRNDAGGVP